MTGIKKRRGMILQERDKQLLREIAAMRVADRDQVMKSAGFGSVTRANARLLALTRARLLSRFFLGSGGGRRALYTLSDTGAELIEVPRRGPRRGRDKVLVADFYVAHQLRINEVYLAVAKTPVPIERASFTRWLTFHEPLASGLSLIPDGYFEVRARTKTVCAFVEVDLGHESAKIWRKKVDAYLRYAAAGTFTTRFGQTQFRALVIGHSERRIKSLRTVTAEATQKIFWFTTFDEIQKSGFWAPIWQRPKDDHHQPLIEVQQ